MNLESVARYCRSQTEPSLEGGCCDHAVFQTYGRGLLLTLGNTASSLQCSGKTGAARTARRAYLAARISFDQFRWQSDALRLLARVPHALEQHCHHLPSYLLGKFAYGGERRM
jgi:hypothetical protein